MYNLIQQQFSPALKETTFRWYVYELKRANIIISVKRGVYKLFTGKKDYYPALSNKQKRVSRLVNKSYSNISYCSWNSSWFNDFAQHQAASNILFLEVESELIEPVFYLLLDNSIQNVYIEPDKETIDDYISENRESVIIKPLITKSPLYKYHSVPIPHLEKILVDLFCDDKLLQAYQGEELIIIFRNAFDEYKVNISRLLNYSRRRNRKVNKLKDFLIQNKILERRLFTT